MTRRKARAQHVNRATAATSQQRAQDLAYIKDNWLQIAAAAWAGYQSEGRGVTVLWVCRVLRRCLKFADVSLTNPLYRDPRFVEL